MTWRLGWAVRLMSVTSVVGVFCGMSAGQVLVEKENWLIKPLDQVKAQIEPEAGPVPTDCSKDLFAPSQGSKDDRPQIPGGRITQFHWKPSELWYQPLYFDDTCLERYGQSCCPLVQPVISGAGFFATFPVMSYKMGIDRTHDRVYTLGYYRPGSHTPCMGQKLPLEMDASLLEAATLVGLILLLP